MTTRTPEHTWFEVSAFLLGDSSTPLDVRNVVASMDMDRNAFCEVTLTLNTVTPTQWALLDPRAIGVENTLYFYVRQFAPNSTTPFTELPVVDVGFDPHARMYLRETTIDDVTGVVTVRATSGEPMLSDKRRIAATTINTGATTVENLFTYSLFDIFGGIAYTVDAVVSSTAIPAGDRRLMLQGESHMDLQVPEMQAINCRIYDYWGRLWTAKDRNSPPTYVGAPSTIRLAVTGANADPARDPIVHSVTRTLSREGEWADGVLIHGQFTNAGGTRVEWWQASGAGVNTKGRVIEMDRAQPAGNIANQIVTRTLIRGAEVTLTASIRFDVRPGQTLGLLLANGDGVVANIRAVEWDVQENLMTIRAETGNPI